MEPQTVHTSLTTAVKVGGVARDVICEWLNLRISTTAEGTPPHALQCSIMSLATFTLCLQLCSAVLCDNWLEVLNGTCNSKRARGSASIRALLKMKSTVCQINFSRSCIITIYNLESGHINGISG